ncbi:hypothetical protein GH714_004896 [Hevea brasiliensis]|uniref:Reverse transcriptase Ty1/copia-type domain-containing protein n=1 Tax=Hevea brasiliensis TaxID=3981 RepID=A0A6A6M7Q8_HEVBR|nr:hypothetical protein GH714_004896 [Hevea brasiliensis]
MSILTQIGHVIRTTVAQLLLMPSSLVLISYPSLSRKQCTVARSSTEAEYKAIGAAAIEVTWLMSLLREISMAPTQPPVLWCDNVGETYLTANSIFHNRMKHIEVEFHFARDMVAKGALQVRYISSKDQIADVFTKGLYIYGS